MALEKIIQKQDNDFLTFARGLVPKSIDPSFVKGILETLISTESHTGRALLERVFITEEVFSV